MCSNYPLVTINSLIYNNAEFFSALLSVIDQTYPSEYIEHIIVDCSTDNSVKTLKQSLQSININVFFLKIRKI